MTDNHSSEGVERLMENPDLAEALGNDRFKQFLDQIPVAVAVSEMSAGDRIVYANLEFQRLTGQAEDAIVGGAWTDLPGDAVSGETRLGEAVGAERDYIGTYALPGEGEPLIVDAWSNIIEDDGGAPVFRLVALVESGAGPSVLDELQDKVREKDTQLRELQHRVKNNLQMITALIRVEAKSVADRTTGDGFDRLAGRVEALGLLYNSLGDGGSDDAVDLGVYLSEIASAVMRAHAVEGIRLDMQVDTWPVSIDVAMPTGLVVNELLTNALKHAFEGRDGGVITLRCVSEASGCRVVVADDGVGLPEGVSWPKPGKLSSLIVRSLLQNAKASINVVSAPGEGAEVTILFTSANAAPVAT
ncbi:histidine kinase dimerization/phosphoacceptor domain -containing protein [Phenylobacterium sp.]|uniref:sensor histidine kinase n=1 Tax=Phenylobacterium sp. TaxID=1871053 RepID=UPI00286A30CA|nr:histidine kinase dimerization/phosphoacceptor domain -containing protein [Phenylobacterium sp.]